MLFEIYHNSYDILRFLNYASESPKMSIYICFKTIKRP